MALLGAAVYDPAAVVEVTTGAAGTAKEMTAFDTTNLRIRFLGPSNGKVLVRVKAQAVGTTTFSRFLFGVLEGLALKGRVSPIGSSPAAEATKIMAQEALWVVTGLTSGQEYVWDAAYGIEVAVEASKIKYGGPNTTAANYGPIIFEVWEATNLLAGTLYDPATAVTTKTTTAAAAAVAFDTTNLRLKFVAPASGRVMWRINTQSHGATANPAITLGILEGATLKGRTAPIWGNPTTATAKSCMSAEASGIITGLTPGTEYTWDAAYGVVTGVTSSALKYGGPNNTTENDAFGGTAFEIWTA